MQIQVTTDSNIRGGHHVAEQVRATVESTLNRFADRLTRVIVHLTDENSSKAHEIDKRCAIEARPAGHPPLAVTNLASTLEESLQGAADKLERLLDHTFGKLDDRQGRTSMSGAPM